MGCICSKDLNAPDYYVSSAENEKEKQKDHEFGIPKSSLVNSKSNITTTLQLNNDVAASRASVDENRKTRIIERPKLNGGIKQTMSRVKGGMLPDGGAAAGWPSWLASVAGEAIRGWTPRTPDSYEKLNKVSPPIICFPLLSALLLCFFLKKIGLCLSCVYMQIGQGTYSSVYRARDLTTDKIVAMKKVRFVNMDPESVRFMAREICILRRLDHPNVMKLEALVTSRISGNLYLVFEYMEHDLAGLLASPRVKFTEPQIKCYARQMFLGLEHCHSRGVLHRDIKGSNLLVDNNGILKIGDFGLATSFDANNRKQPLTSHVVTLWYRAPELLLGETHYGVAVDMWSAGCILAELFAGKPIMPGTTEVEQMHKIFKLCGSPTEEYWRKTKLPHTGSFKSQRVYKRRVADAFKDFPSSALNLVQVLLSIDPELRGSASSALKSQFFTSDPLPCAPSSLPKYRPSKEFDVKLREQEARRQVIQEKQKPLWKLTRFLFAQSLVICPIIMIIIIVVVLVIIIIIIMEQGQSNNKSNIEKYKPAEEENGVDDSIIIMQHPKSVGRKLMDDDDDDVHSILVRTLSSSGSGAQQLMKQASQLHQIVIEPSSNYHSNNDPKVVKEYAPKRNRIFCSGPLMPTGGAGNMEDMLKEHERQIQQVVRKARLHKSRTKD
ncbi:PREDICTED: probable serine/threonine-protein kinase At1g54610 [Erythranthe guttata]|uniref:probable serine/threonine-protein kinase At1g54610 n=1 Tax=Erythranthe guttata TaxID=4155 RepID=UPI00064DF101|nr:PREDICTED: probable serine/threonine-protein kinase At1g54610 [Erythranthe guttata]|eukprot:XP_012846433.1 PREDICTED: probable serine/threonine-protein kinase At1g54610 [Erythranthe guttata]